MKKMISVVVMISASGAGWFFFSVDAGVAKPGSPYSEARSAAPTYYTGAAPAAPADGGAVTVAQVAPPEARSHHSAAAGGHRPVDAAEVKEVPIPADAVLETGEGAPHHVDFETFLAVREERRQRIADHFDWVLEGQSEDAEWQSQLATQAETALMQIGNLKGVSVTDTRCGESICRLKINAKDRDVHKQISAMSTAIGLLLGSDSWSRSDERELVSVVYLSRAGEKLPAMGE